MCNRTGDKTTANSVAMVFRVHSRHVGLLLTYWCSQLAIIFNFMGTVC